MNTQKLISEYLEYGCTLSDLERKYDISRYKLKKLFKDNNVPLKDHKKACAEKNSLKRISIPTKEVLYDLYVIQLKGVDDLENIFRVGQETIYLWLAHHGIKIRTLSESCKIAKQNQFSHLSISKDYLIKYFDLGYTKKDLTELFKCSLSHLNKALRDHDLELNWDKPTRSKVEIELFNFCQNIRPDIDWKHTNRSVINPFELDIVSHELKIAIEYCGIYWHSESSGKKDRNYHLNKKLKAAEKGYELYTIFETDDIDKVKRFLYHKLGKSRAVYARKCEVKNISSSIAKSFHNENHIHGYVGSSINLGLYHKDELVQVASFGKSRYNKNYALECTRSSLKAGLSVVGGTSKLFSRIKEPLITYADLRFGSGKVYSHCNLLQKEITPPNYYYFHKDNRLKLFSRVNFQKHKLTNFKIYDENMTEWEIMQANDWDRIWDCGNAKFVTINS